MSFVIKLLPSFEFLLFDLWVMIYVIIWILTFLCWKTTSKCWSFVYSSNSHVSQPFFTLFVSHTPHHDRTSNSCYNSMLGFAIAPLPTFSNFKDVVPNIALWKHTFVGLMGMQKILYNGITIFIMYSRLSSLVEVFFHCVAKCVEKSAQRNHDFIVQVGVN